MVRRATNARFTNALASLVARLAFSACADFFSSPRDDRVARFRGVILLRMKSGIEIGVVAAALPKTSTRLYP